MKLRLNVHRSGGATVTPKTRIESVPTQPQALATRQARSGWINLNYTGCQPQMAVSSQHPVTAPE
jgi:hypothetical protein